jgi:hypothetical protein
MSAVRERRYQSEYRILTFPPVLVNDLEPATEPVCGLASEERP